MFLTKYSRAFSTTSHDYFHIQNCIHQFFHYLDAGNSEKLTQLFHTPISISLVQKNIQLHSKQDIEQFCQFIQSKFPHAQHWEGNVAIQLQGNNATNFSYWKAIQGNKILSMGTHQDTFIKVNQTWKFASRIITHTSS